MRRAEAVRGASMPQTTQHAVMRHLGAGASPHSLIRPPAPQPRRRLLSPPPRSHCTPALTVTPNSREAVRRRAVVAFVVIMKAHGAAVSEQQGPWRSHEINTRS